MSQKNNKPAELGASGKVARTASRITSQWRNCQNYQQNLQASRTSYKPAGLHGEEDFKNEWSRNTTGTSQKADEINEINATM